MFHDQSAGRAPEALQYEIKKQEEERLAALAKPPKVFWVSVQGQDPVQKNETELQEMVDRLKTDLDVIPFEDAATGVWKKASEFGFVVPAASEGVKAGTQDQGDFAADEKDMSPAYKAWEILPNKDLFEQAKAIGMDTTLSRPALIQALVDRGINPA